MSSVYTYIFSSVLLILYLFFIYLFGKSILSDERSVWYTFLTGYIISTVVFSLFGIVVQFLNIPWIVYCAYFWIIVLLMFFFVIYRIRKDKISIVQEMKTFYSKQFIILFISLLLVFISVLYVHHIWYNNFLDDGYYLTKYATLPFDNNYSASFASGFSGQTLINYLLSTTELEGSVILHTFRLEPTIYIRVFLSMFNYFVLANIICAVVREISTALKLEIKEYKYQFFSIIIILFSCCELYLKCNNIFTLQDSNQFITAMFYGSSVVRTVGILLLIAPFINNDKIVLKDFITFGIVSVFLITRSGIALPIIALIGILFINVWLTATNKKYGVILNAISIVGLSLITIFYPSNPGTIYAQGYCKTMIANNYQSLFLWIIIIVFLLSFFFKNKTVFIINSVLVLYGCLIFIEPINKLFAILSVHAFVSGRIVTNYIYTLMILSFAYMVIWIYNLFKKEIVINIVTIASFIMVFTLSLVSFQDSGGGIFEPNCNADIIHSLRVQYRNRMVSPTSTKLLANTLNDLGNSKNKEIRFLMPQEVLCDKATHNPAIIIRSFAPKLKSVTALIRYPSNDSLYSQFKESTQMEFLEYANDPNEANQSRLKKICKKYKINCLVFTNTNAEDSLKNIGFRKYKTVIPTTPDTIYYHIYYNFNY